MISCLHIKRVYAPSKLLNINVHPRQCSQIISLATHNRYRSKQPWPAKTTMASYNGGLTTTENSHAHHCHDINALGHKKFRSSASLLQCPDLASPTACTVHYFLSLVKPSLPPSKEPQPWNIKHSFIRYQ